MEELDLLVCQEAAVAELLRLEAMLHHLLVAPVVVEQHLQYLDLLLLTQAEAAQQAILLLHYRQERAAQEVVERVAQEQALGQREAQTQGAVVAAGIAAMAAQAAPAS